MNKLFLTAAVLAIGFAPQGGGIAFAKKQQPDPSIPASISAKDKQVGAKAHPELVNEFGGLYDGPQAAYVTRIGQKIAVQSGLSNAQSDFTVSLLNSPVNNAFAIPGGYVYVTRQLLGLMNDEAELASVMGHEVGHVAAQHAKKRNSRATTGTLGAIAATVLGQVLGGGEGAKLGQQLGGALAQRWVLGYSRAQEYEADDLGVSYLVKAGYDPSASSTMLASLAAQTSLDARRSGKSEKSLPEWASTHPDPASRVARAQQKALATGSTNKTRNGDAFIAGLDGMLYDDDPKQGVVDGQTFKHPDLRMTFTAPSGYTMSNGSDAVTVGGSGGKAQLQGGNPGGDLRGYVGKVFQAVGGQTPLNYGTVSTTTINGLTTAYATATANTQSSGAVDVTVYAYEFSPTSAFHFVMLVPSGQGTGPFSSMIQSMRRMTAEQAAAVKPRRIDVVTVRSNDTVQSLANRMAYPDFQVDRFRTLNALGPNETLQSGRKVKIVVLADK
jgi:predicted Zn-dependent protease